MGRRVALDALRRRRRARLIAIIVPSCALLLLAGAATWVLVRGVTARDLLEGAIPTVDRIQEAVLAGEGEAAEEEAADLKSVTANAAALTSDPVWRGAELLPWFGPNLTAVRTAASVTDDLVANVVQPATGFSLDSLQPEDGRIKIAAVRDAADFVDNAAAELTRGLERLDAVETENLLPQVVSGVERLRGALTEADSVVTSSRPAIELLPAMLGGEGRRNYLFIFQNNAESRGTGGNPASLALITVDDGLIDLTTQANSQEFRNGARPLVLPLDEETLALYGQSIGVYVQDISLTPDFPTTAQLARAYWNELFPDQIDGVVSFDPIGLQRLLGATGPVTLSTGDVLEPESAASLLLNGVYFRYEDPADQDAFFAAAAASVFDAVTGGGAEARPLIDAMTASIEDGNLMFWSAHPEEQEIIEDLPLSGRLPTDNAEATVFGTYFNDTTGSKMDYYVRTQVQLEVASCSSAAMDATLAVILTNTLDQAQASTLPKYIQGVNYHFGLIATNVVLYGPIGGQVGSITLDGQPAPPAYTGYHLGRPVVKFSILNGPGQSHEMKVQFTGGEGAYGPAELRGTPMVQTTESSVQGEACSEAR